MTPYVDRDLGQLWLRQWLVAWRHQAITWTNVDLSTLRSYAIHPRALSWEDLKLHTNKIRMKFEFLKSHPALPGSNELTHWSCVIHMNWIIFGQIMVWCLFRSNYDLLSIGQKFQWNTNQNAMIFILLMTFSNSCAWMKIYEFRLMFHWSFFLRFELTIFQH